MLIYNNIAGENYEVDSSGKTYKLPKYNILNVSQSLTPDLLSQQPSSSLAFSNKTSLKAENIQFLHSLGLKVNYHTLTSIEKRNQ